MVASGFGKHRLAEAVSYLPRQADKYVVAPLGGIARDLTQNAAEFVLGKARSSNVAGNRFVQKAYNTLRQADGVPRLTVDTTVAYGALTALALGLAEVFTPGTDVFKEVGKFYDNSPLVASTLTAGGLAALLTATDVAVSKINDAYVNPAIKRVQRNVIEGGVSAVLLTAAGIAALVSQAGAPVGPAPTPTPIYSPAPTASAAPQPTATPTYTLTPTPAATATPRPTSTATPYATATPTAKPTATPTPYVTATPSATATPKPTATATPSPTATPTARPTATPSPTPRPTLVPGLEAILNANTFGISYDLAKDLFNYNTQAFNQGLGISQYPEAVRQMPGFFDGNPANNEAVNVAGNAVRVDLLSTASNPPRNAEIYTKLTKEPLHFKIIDGGVLFKGLLGEYLLKNPSRVGEVTFVR